jgi:hypothetical protein
MYLLRMRVFGQRGRSSYPRILRRHTGPRMDQMPPGPIGEKRRADVIGNAVHVVRIATSKIEEDRGSTPNRAKGWKKGGKARARSLSPSTAREIAHAAAVARWKKG